MALRNPQHDHDHNRPLEDWGKLIGDVPSATAILDRFLHHATILQITGKSYRLRNQSSPSAKAHIEVLAPYRCACSKCRAGN